MNSLNNDNYYSVGIDREYMSYSQYKSFIRCAYQAMGYLDGKIKYPKNDSMLIGSLVDAYFEGTYDSFCEKNKEDLYAKGGKLYAKFSCVEDMIQTLEKDPYCMEFLTGEKQYIIKTEWLGIPWKAKLDVLGSTFITDLKTTKELNNGNFIKEWGYYGQLAVYGELLRIATNEHKRRDLYIVAVTSEKYPDKNVYHLNNEDTIQNEINQIRQNLEWIIKVKNRQEEPIRCGKCFYCRNNKKIFTAEEI